MFADVLQLIDYMSATPTRSLLIHSRQTYVLFTHAAHLDSELGSWQGQVHGQIMRTVVFTRAVRRYSACVNGAYVARILSLHLSLHLSLQMFLFIYGASVIASGCISPKLILFQFAVEACDPNSDEWGVWPFWCNGRFDMNKASELSSCDRVPQITCWCQVTTEFFS